MQIVLGKNYLTRSGEVVTADFHYPNKCWFSWKIRRENNTYYTVTDSGRRLWNTNDDEDLIEEIK